MFHLLPTLGFCVVLVQYVAEIKNYHLNGMSNLSLMKVVLHIKCLLALDLLDPGTKIHKSLYKDQRSKISRIQKIRDPNDQRSKKDQGYKRLKFQKIIDSKDQGSNRLGIPKIKDPKYQGSKRSKFQKVKDPIDKGSQISGIQKIKV